MKVVVIFGREGQGWGGWGHRRHGRGVGKLGALQEACSGNPPRDVNALSKRGPNPNSQPPMRPFLETYTQEHSRNGKRGNNLDLIGSCRLVWTCLFVFNVD